VLRNIHVLWDGFYDVLGSKDSPRLRTKTVNSNARLFACSQEDCLATVKTSADGNRLVKQVHSDVCPFPSLEEGFGSAFKLKTDLTIHLLNYMPKKTIACPVTNRGRAFKSQCHFGYHTPRFHSDDTVYYSTHEECNYGTKVKTNLMIHTRSTNGALAT
jgi:hypothetical protein